LVAAARGAFVAKGYHVTGTEVGMSRPPNHNAVVERFHGTVLQECWRPAFHRRRFISQ
jgi:hypothetical protein